MFRLESIPRGLPGVSRFDGQIGDVTSKEITPDLGKSFQVEWRNVPSARRALSAQFVKSVEKLVDGRGERDERRPGVNALARDFDATALSTDPLVSIEDGDVVSRASQKSGGRQSTEPGTDDDDASRGHGYIPSVMPVTSCTPATAPATYGKATEYL